tara:strand:- start:139 stop:1002 length:864 start_codon:yes stop_codon:yes gene_type:complete
MEKFKLKLKELLLKLKELLLKLDPTQRWAYSFKFSIFSFIVSLVLSLVISLVSWLFRGEYYEFFEDVVNRGILFSIIGLITGLTLIRYFYKLNYTWSGFNKTGSIISLFYFLYSYILYLIFDISFFSERLLFFLFMYTITTAISGIFLEKTSYKIKFKRLLGVILFVWAIYKLITSFTSNSEKEPYGVDTDGDGIKDSFDTDGDGVIDTVMSDTDGDGVFDTVMQDTDGDGLIDRISSDTDGDGILDTVIADTDGDGLADTIIKDVDLDGDGKSDFRITRRKGKGLT